MAVRRVIDDGSSVSFTPVVPAPRPAADPVTQLFPLEPGNFDLAIYRGDTYEWVFQLMALDGLPIDIFLWKFKAQIRDGVDGTLMAGLQPMYSVSPDVNPTDDDGAVREELRNGLIRMRLTADQSRNVDHAGVWDLECVTVDGWVKTILRGKVEYLGDVTTGLVDMDL
jgi:hypothetical protein